MDVSIVIVSWNTKEILRDCLHSVYKQAGKITHEVIVVDNASSDDTTSRVAREFPTVKLIRNKVNRGFAAASCYPMAYSLLLSIGALNHGPRNEQKKRGNPHTHRGK